MKTKTFLIIVTFNPELGSFKKNFLSHVHSDCDGIIVVDNDSKNQKQIINAMQNCDKILIFSCLDSNYGISKAQNVGVKIAKEHSCTHVIFFDQDSTSQRDITTKLINEESQLISKGISVGAIGPIYIDPRTKNYYPLAFLSGFRLKTIFPKKGEDSPINVSFIIASGSLVRINVLDNVGEFHEPFFIDLVDIEWCFRASSKGYRIYVSPKVVLEHSIGDKRIASLGKEISIHSPIRRYYMVRNNILLARLNHVPITYRIRILSGVVLRSIRFLFVVNFEKSYIQAIGIGIIDGLKNKGGVASKSYFK